MRGDSIASEQEFASGRKYSSAETFGLHSVTERALTVGGREPPLPG